MERVEGSRGLENKTEAGGGRDRDVISRLLPLGNLEGNTARDKGSGCEDVDIVHISYTVWDHLFTGSLVY